MSTEYTCVKCFIPRVTPLGSGGDFKMVYWLVFSHWRQAIERDSGISDLSLSCLSPSGPEVSGFALPCTSAMMHCFTTGPKHCGSWSWAELHKMWAKINFSVYKLIIPVIYYECWKIEHNQDRINLNKFVKNKISQVYSDNIIKLNLKARYLKNYQDSEIKQHTSN
jgi:hypothetical protein